MPLSEKRRIQIRQTLLIAFVWMLLGLPIAVYDHVLLRFFEVDSNQQYNFISNALSNAAGGLMAGLTVLPVYIFYYKERFQRYSFLAFLLLTAGYFVGAIALIFGLVSTGLNVLLMDLPPWHPSVRAAVLESFGNPMFLRIEMLWFFISTLTVFMIRVNEKYGQGVLRDFLLGRYHEPKQDFRIFMFLDLKSSTTIAERLGDVAYFRFLSDFFADITDIIVNHRGKIYQYVGDEVVVSWDLKDGRRNDNCVRCFFAIEAFIELRKSYYEALYGLRPRFKAGLHYGRTTVGEIGLIKKDIVFSGDALNTTARIQSQCNDHDALLLVSSDLREQLPLENGFRVNSIGELHLRGKAEPLELFSVEKVNPS